MRLLPQPFLKTADCYYAQRIVHTWNFLSHFGNGFHKTLKRFHSGSAHPNWFPCTHHVGWALATTMSSNWFEVKGEMSQWAQTWTEAYIDSVSETNQTFYIRNRVPVSTSKFWPSSSRLPVRTCSSPGCQNDLVEIDRAQSTLAVVSGEGTIFQHPHQLTLSKHQAWRESTRGDWNALAASGARRGVNIIPL